MTDLARHDFTRSLLTLLKETFEQSGSAYLDKGAALFQTLDALTPEAASRTQCAGVPTIAAHCAHLAYYVRVVRSGISGREEPADWPSSWQPQQVDDREWDELKAGVRREYESLIETVENLESWGDQEVGDAMATVAHTAYHLGAIRRALRSLEPVTPP